MYAISILQPFSEYFLFRSLPLLVPGARRITYLLLIPVVPSPSYNFRIQFPIHKAYLVSQLSDNIIHSFPVYFVRNMSFSKCACYFPPTVSSCLNFHLPIFCLTYMIPSCCIEDPDAQGPLFSLTVSSRRFISGLVVLPHQSVSLPPLPPPHLLFPIFFLAQLYY